MKNGGIYERVFKTVFDEKQNGYLRSGRLQEVVPTRELTRYQNPGNLEISSWKMDSLKTKK